MAKWMSPDEEMPEVFAGDRIIGIVKFRDNGETRVTPHVAILIATEYGWRDVEDLGHTIHDCELWTKESDLVKIVDVMST